jgi:putative membrane protein insertion efficiency factor
MRPGVGSPEPAPECLHLGQRLVVFCLLFYKSAFSPMLPTFCKFHPTCSMYAKEAVERHGVWRGAQLAIRRLLRCRPFAAGGCDPVPDA